MTKKKHKKIEKKKQEIDTAAERLQVKDNDHNKIVTSSEEVQKDQPETSDDQSFAGSMPDPDSDDDTEDMEKEVGLITGKDEDEGHPKPIDIGEKINKAEEYERTH